MQKRIYASFFGLLFVFFVSIFTASFAAAAPVITNIQTITTTPYTAVFRWSTTIASDSWVDLNPTSSTFFEYRDPNTNQMLGRCDGGGEVINHCVALLTAIPNKTYLFRIKSCAASGADCSTTTLSSFTSASDIKAPTRPTNFSTVSAPAIDHVALTLQISSDDAPRHYPGYNIYRNGTIIKSIPPVRFTPIESVTITPSSLVLVESAQLRDINLDVPLDVNQRPVLFFTDYDVSPNTTYTYYATAFDLGGNESLPSNGIQVHTPAACPSGFVQTGVDDSTPPAPICIPITPGAVASTTPIITNLNIVTATAPYTATFTWQTNLPSDSWVDIDPGGSSFQYQDPNTGQMVGRCDGGGQVTNHCVTLLTPVPGKIYPVRIRSCTVNNAGCGFSTISSFTSATDTVPPTIPTDIQSAITGTGHVELTWAPSRDNAPRYYPGYEVYRNGTLIKTIDPLRYIPDPKYRDLNVNVPIQVSNTPIQYVDFDAAANTSYTYFIKALDIGGNRSAQSNPIVVSTASIQCTRTTALSCAQTLIRDLQVGSTGDDVKTLQEVLIQQGVYPEAIISGYFGALTKQAVILFQKKYGIDATGIVGQITRAKVNEILASILTAATTLTRDLQVGSTGNDVKILQGVLVQEQVYPEAVIDGFFGATTKQAVILFQRKYSIQDTGIVDAATRAKVNEILASGSTASKTLERDLQVGNTGNDVKILQEVLIQENVYPEAIVSGFFGQLTKQAVILFQQKYAITDTAGVVQLATRTKVNQILITGSEKKTLTRTLQIGSEGDDVKILQELLVRQNVSLASTTISGFFGPLTEGGVVLFQQKYGITDTAGVVETATRAKMNAILATE